ncbi:MAG: UvrD-helicase domain-containing protein [Candidatus Omnitrophica bacterium]|nr:UvrD-helicase domain-containing protein [Candidatus Omnitrophota bacterium]
MPFVDDDHVDDTVDQQISACLTLEKPKSFFLFAGAGSGKTRSLVEALKVLRLKKADQLRQYGQRIGVITYTNAACDEIKQRLEYDSLIEVSTIHSFVWSLIGSFHADIRSWLIMYLNTKIDELNEKQRKGRPGKASLDRQKEIETKKERLANLNRIKRFTYNPNGDNFGQDSLNHSEVIEIGSYFLTQKSLMQEVLVNKFPILLIDESQDTIKSFMEALFQVQKKHSEHFVLGLFGDTMQRIYGHGKEDLERDIPAEWEKPSKQMNHRCPLRIIKLINKIRSEVDRQVERPRSDKEEGFVRFFILSTGTTNKLPAEYEIRKQMATITNDSLWTGSDTEVKILILEHHMAARRMGFIEMFEPLYAVSSLTTGLLDGSLPGLRLFSHQVLPIIKARDNDDKFAIAAILRKYSPLLSKDIIKTIEEDQSLQIEKARKAVESLLSLWGEDKKPRFLDVLRNVAQTGLFEIPESLRPIASRSGDEQIMVENTKITPPLEEDDDSNSILDAWDKFLLTPFEQIKLYDKYINGQAAFGTHQGIKGLEFQRVMVIMDDNEARGFMFSYDKLLGTKEKTETDIRNEQEGKDTGINRTRRLFYVTCSRTQKSLAIVYYSPNPEKTRSQLLDDHWFESNEIILFSAT